MSLPTATKDTSAHPGKNSVSVPVDKKEKAADVDRKLRFYGVIEAFRQGRFPTNQQIDRTLKHVLESRPVDEDKLSSEGRKLIEDTRDIIETLRLIVQRKNSDELLQNFFWHTRDTSAEGARKDPNEVLPLDKQKAQDDGQQAIQHLRTLLTLIATNSEVRKLLSDFSLIGRDLLARGAAHAAEAVRPDQDALAGVDRPAPQDQFQTAGGRKVGPDETPVAETSIPVPGREDAKVRHDPHEGTEIEHEGEVKKGDEALKEVKEVRQRAQTAKEQSKEAGVQEMNGTQQEIEEENVDPEMKKQGLKARLQGMKNGFTDRVPLPQEHKESANERFERGRKFFTEEYFPEERRDQFIYRGKKVILECQKHNDYQESVRWLLNFIEEYVSHGKSAVGQGKESQQRVTSNPALQQATTEIRTLLERFANGQSMDPIFDAINKLTKDARDDEDFRKWFSAVDAYAHKVLLEPGYVLEPACNAEGRDLRESGRHFYDDKYKAHFDNLFSTIGNWFKAMSEDPLNKRFGDDWARLTRDLLFDSEGSLKFKPELWMDIRKVILPMLVDQVGYVPIPRVEYTDEGFDLVVENLTLQGRNLFPNVVAIEAHNYIKFSPYNAVKDENHHEFTLTFGHMQADMRDVAFYFKKKTGIKLSDSGLADVLLGGRGLTATIHLVSSDKDPSSVFKVKNVHVKVDSLKFSIRDSKHDVLYKTLRPLATGLVKRQIQKAVADSITTGMEYVDGRLVHVRERMREAKESDETSRTQVLQEMFSRKKEDAMSTKSSGKSHSQFKVVAKRDSALLPEAGHPSGWANLAQDRKESAKAGEDWRSDAFSVV